MLLEKTTNVNISVKKALISLFSGFIIVAALFYIVCFNLNTIEQKIDAQKDKTQQQKDKEKQDFIDYFSIITV